jgi:carboxymethylenebutenolidase
VGALREGPVDPAEVSVEQITLPVGGVPVPATHARPDGMPAAGVVVHPDIMGLRPLFDDMAARLATHGLAVMVVEPFARIPAEERARLDPPARMERIATLSDEVQLGDLEAAADHLVVHDDVTRVSVIGFCMGGHYALKAAASGRFDAAVAFYGMIRTPEAWRGPGVGEPLEVADKACPTLAIFGSADPWTPPADIDALRQAWAGRDDCEVVVVEGADHGFVHDPDRPAHRPDDAAAAWERALSYLLP